MGRKAVPIIVGVGEVKNNSKRVEDAFEPMELMLQAIDRAFENAGVPPSAEQILRSSIDSIDVVRNWTWEYPDILTLLAKRLQVNPQHGKESDHGGNQPTRILDEAARRISNRESKVALITGGEALASYGVCAAANKLPPPGWTKLEKASNPISPRTALLPEGISRVHGVGRPTQLYAMYETALAAHRGQSIEGSIQESAELYGQYAKIAEKNPYAWSYGKPAQTAQSIGTVSKKNRLICLPYPLLMNAFNTVNLAAACVITSTEYAEKLGIPKEKWIYVLGGAGTSDEEFIWDRPNFYTSPCVSQSLDAALKVASLTPKDIDLLDIYSCFPVVPKIAALHLGLPVVGGSKPLSLTGGMNSFGGAGNNFSMHAVTEMVRQIRDGRGQNGLVLANGGHLTYQHVIVLSRSPHPNKGDYPAQNPLPKILPEKGPPLDQRAKGEAIIETYTVEFDRNGSPEQAFIIGRLDGTGHRFVANPGSASALWELASRSSTQVGRKGYVYPDSQTVGRNLFVLGTTAKDRHRSNL